MVMGLDRDTAVEHAAGPNTSVSIPPARRVASSGVQEARSPFLGHNLSDSMIKSGTTLWHCHTLQTTTECRDRFFHELMADCRV